MTLITNPPPTVDYAPSELRADLVAMQNLEVGQLLAITEIQISPSQQKLHLQLLVKRGVKVSVPLRGLCKLKPGGSALAIGYYSSFQSPCGDYAN